MTPAVKTVTRQVTLRDLEALFEKHEFNAFPVVEAELGIVTKFDFLQAFAFTKTTGTGLSLDFTFFQTPTVGGVRDLPGIPRQSSPPRVL